MIILELLLIVLALLGNGALWFAVFNNLHSRKGPHWAHALVSITCYSAVVFIPVAYIPWYWYGGGPFTGCLTRNGLSLPTVYWLISLLVCLYVAMRRMFLMMETHKSVVLTKETEHHTRLDRRTDQYEAPGWITALASLPGNQLLDLSVHRIELEIPRLPKELDGMKIAHLSDLHFTGRIGKAYFEEVVRHTLEMEPDLIAVTGDLVDMADCFDWIPDTLGKLKAPCGVYYILGNHDTRVDSVALRKELKAHSLIDMGSRWLEIMFRGRRIILAGNELPWFVPAADLEHAPEKDTNGEPIRILLSHSPDQFSWARGHQVDLMLAGHTHGGQIRLPVIGALVSPCREGTRYAIGTYYRPPTVMHVTRGLSGTVPLRISCPPELSLLVLRSEQ